MYIVLKRGPGKEGVVKSGQPVVGREENANCARATCSRDHEKRGLSTDMERKQKRKKKEKKRKAGEEEGEVFELENAGTEKEGDGGGKEIVLVLASVVCNLAMECIRLVFFSPVDDWFFCE